jgi:hypothetical protein
MAVANTKSTAITNGDARNPRVIGSGYIQGAGIEGAVGTVEVAAADDNDSVYRFVRVPSGCRIHKVAVMSDAITAGTVFHVGLYKTAENGGAVVDADFFAASLDLSNGNTVPVEVTFGNVLDIDDIEKRLWEVLGLDADPFTEYDICLTGATVGTGAGTISLRAEWVK